MPATERGNGAWVGWRNATSTAGQALQPSLQLLRPSDRSFQQLGQAIDLPTFGSEAAKGEGAVDIFVA